MEDETRKHCCPLRIGDAVPAFTARSTQGPVAMKDFEGRWLAFFSHPADFTPVCTSEFVAFARAAERFAELDCALMALSVDSLYAHFAWLRAIRDHYEVEVTFPVVEDPTLVIGRAYGMVANDAHDAGTVRTVFIIDPAQVVRAIVTYPVEIGRSVEEVLRIVAALQVADAGKGLPPEGWEPGKPLFAHPEPTMDSVLSADNPVGWFLKECE
ncbi:MULTISPECIES: peroxiredoxin [Novosphingobium]|uniref:Alkyl hydroperoxide reductase C n=1 Tax=Novosphingobium decolorationis TaxID=2698673 RepID=A0ABX8E5Z7_9SPHN|nr:MULTISPECIES: peroxiredoxin [Novosphingobium]QVM84612.1 peroxiredoxin [Novosphingobium decolorationis]